MSDVLKNKCPSELTLWNELKKLNLVQGSLAEENTDRTPWYIRAMKGFAGWVAAIFLLAFLAIFFSWIFSRESASVLISLGLVGNLFAYAIFYQKNKNEFLHQLGLVFNLCGQLMVAWGVYEAITLININFYFSLLLYQILLVVTISDFVSRVLSTWFAMMALFSGLTEMGLFNISASLASLAFVVVWINDQAWLKLKNLWLPIGYGTALTILQLSSLALFGDGSDLWFHTGKTSWFSRYGYWFNELLMALIFIGILMQLVKQYQIDLQSKPGMLILLSEILLIVMGHFIIGTSGALFLLLIGFMKQKRLLVIAGSLSLLAFISWYYYNLESSLLTKSVILISFGISFFIGFYLLNVLSGGTPLSFLNLSAKYSITSSKKIVMVSLLLVLFLVNFNIYKKERILEEGQILLLQLAPVDPRSLMQGDYMRLQFSIEQPLLESQSNQTTVKKNSGYFIVNLDSNNVGTLSQNEQNMALGENQIKVQFRIRSNRIKLATHAFFFQEDTGEQYVNAKYGEFRVADNGELLLNSLRDENFNVLGLNRPSN